VIRDGWRPEKPGELEAAVAVRRAHHGNLDALIAQSSDTSGPFSFDRGPPFEIEAELAKESDRRFEVVDDDSYVVHPFNRHGPNLQGGDYSDNGPWVNCSVAVRVRRGMRCPRTTDKLLTAAIVVKSADPRTVPPQLKDYAIAGGPNVLACAFPLPMQPQRAIPTKTMSAASGTAKLS
jgi:uncharacterized protein YciI